MHTSDTDTSKEEEMLLPRDISVTLVCTRTNDSRGTAKKDDPRIVNGVWIEYRVKSVKNATTPIVGAYITKEEIDALIKIGIEVNIVRS